MKISVPSILTAAFVLMVCLNHELKSENISYPPGANVINITSYAGIDLADNGNDDTAAIQQAIYDHIHKGKTIYFPNGVYNINTELLWKKANGQWETDLAFQGQSEEGTIFKLRDGVYPTVTNDGNGNPILYGVIVTASQNPNSSTGSGNQAFQNSIRNLTVDTGANNAAAVGIKYLSNNCGQISNVTIRSGDPAGIGYAGLSMTRSWPGPSLIKNVTINGFNYGVDIKHWEYGLVFEHLDLQGQLVAGIRNKENVLSIRGLTSQNSVSVILAESDQGHIALIDASCVGGSSATQAIRFKGGLLARNLSTTGYGAAIRNNNTSVTVPGNNVTEYISHPVQTKFPSPLQSLGLNIEETPEYENYDPATWHIVDDSAADDTAAIQAAMNSGKSTICFKSGARYKISNTITVSGAVRRIIGLNSGLEVTGSFLTSTDPNKAVFRFENISGADVTFERFSFFPFFNQYPAAKFTWFVHATTKPLILKNICSFHGEAYRNTVQGGKVFMEDLAMWGFYFNNQNVWARQVNPEFHSNPMMVNEGANGKLWILGLKTEGAATVIETKGGAATEILGGLIYPIDPPGGNPMFINNESSVSLSYAETGSGNNFSVLVRETRGGDTADYLKSTANSVGLPRGGKTMPLYTGYPLSTPAAPSGLQAVTVSDSAIDLDWVDNSGQESGFEAQYKTGSGNWVALSTEPANSTALQVAGLNANTTYAFRVRAINSSGGSAWSNEATATTLPTGGGGGTVNLALDGIISAYSLQQVGNEASKAIDGIDNTDNNRWAAYNYPQWIEIDLGSDLSVAGTELIGAANRAYRFTVQARTSAGSYTTIVDRTTNTSPSPVTDTLTSPVTARYIRLTVTGAHNYTGGWVSIREFKVLGQQLAPESTNLGPSSVVSAFSAQQTGNEAEKLIDGIDNTDNNRWSASGYPSWVEIDLGSTKTLTGSELITFQGRIYKFRIETKVAGGTYATILDRSANTSPSPIADTFVSPVSARYVKLTITGAHNYTGGWASIRELKIFGY